MMTDSTLNAKALISTVVDRNGFTGEMLLNAKALISTVVDAYINFMNGLTQCQGLNFYCCRYGSVMLSGGLNAKALISTVVDA